MSQANPLTLLRDGIAAAKAGDKGRTRQLLRQATQLDPRNELAWLWLAGVAESPQDALNCLHRVLAINPANGRARDGLKSVRLQAAVTVEGSVRVRSDCGDRHGGEATDCGGLAHHRRGGL